MTLTADNPVAWLALALAGALVGVMIRNWWNRRL